MLLLNLLSDKICTLCCCFIAHTRKSEERVKLAWTVLTCCNYISSRSAIISPTFVLRTPRGLFCLNICSLPLTFRSASASSLLSTVFSSTSPTRCTKMPSTSVNRLHQGALKSTNSITRKQICSSKICSKSF